MDKKICKYELSTIFKSIVIYYMFFIGIVLFLGVMPSNDGVGEITFQGLNLATMILLLVSSLCILKPSFYFAQGNNISRKNFIKGTIETGAVLSIILAAIDLILIKLMNMFVNCINIYEMVFGKIEYSGVLDIIINNILMYLFSALLYFVVYLISLIITTIYFKINTVLKVLWAITSVFILFVTLAWISNIGYTDGSIINRYNIIIIFIILIAVLILIEVLLGKNIKEGLDKISLKGTIILIVFLVAIVVISSLVLSIGSGKTIITGVIPIESEVQESDNYFSGEYNDDFQVELEVEVEYGQVEIEILDGHENILWSKTISEKESKDVYFEEVIHLKGNSDKCIIRVKNEEACGELKYSIKE